MNRETIFMTKSNQLTSLKKSRKNHTEHSSGTEIAILHSLHRKWFPVYRNVPMENWVEKYAMPYHLLPRQPFTQYKEIASILFDLTSYVPTNKCQFKIKYQNCIERNVLCELLPFPFILHLSSSS